MEMPKPGAAQQQLAKLAGNWTGKETIHPMPPFDPKGGSATAKVTNRVALDGWVVVQDYEQDRGGGVNFRGHGLFSIDPATGETTMHWWDSISGCVQRFAGSWKGDLLTLANVGPMGHARASFDVSRGGYRFTMEVSQDGERWAPFMNGSYAK